MRGSSVTRSVRRILAIAVLCVVSVGAFPLPAAAARMDQIVDLVSTKLDVHPLVGIGEQHGWEEAHLLRMALIRDPRVLCKIDAVAVEFGNSALQPIADRFVSGQQVSARELHSIWRDTGQWMVWDSPIYRQFFEAAREVNLNRVCPKPVRIILADPPVDWTKIKSAADYERFRKRDGFFADIVKRDILAKGLRALIIAGDAHLWKWSPKGMPWGLRMGEIIERDHPGALFSIVDLPVPSMAATAGLPPATSVTVLKDSPLGKRSFASLLDPEQVIKVVLEGKPIEVSMGKLDWPASEKVVDAFVNLGPGTHVEADPAVYHDPVYQAQLRERAVIMKAVHRLDFIAMLEEELAKR